MAGKGKNVEEILGKIKEACDSKEVDYEIYRTKSAGDATEYVKKKALENGLIHSIFDFVEKNFDKSCTLDDLSKTVGYNHSYLSRYFSESTGMTFVSYVNQYRISRACYMLKSGGKTVVECAYDSGYTSLRSFNRNFKLYVGVSPRNFRSAK